MNIPCGFKVGDYVVHVTASLFSCDKIEVFSNGIYPFCYWDDYSAANYRLATPEEIAKL